MATRSLNSKRRSKLKPKKLRTKETAKYEQIIQELTQELATDEDIKEIKQYPKQKCVEEGCKRNAVGSGDTCKRHGGDPLIRENLMAEHQVPDIVRKNSFFDPAVHPIAFISLSKDGKSEVEIAAEFEVSVYTLRNWSETFLEFNTAYEIGQALYEAWWLTEGRENLDNRNYNVGLYKYLTMNKLGFSDKVESKSLHVHAGVLQVPAKVDIDEWEQNAKKS